VPRFLHECDGDGRRLRLATLFQMTMPGAPSLYYGDEIGMTGGGGPDNRRTFPWDDRARWDMDTHGMVCSLARLRAEVQDAVPGNRVAIEQALRGHELQEVHAHGRVGEQRLDRPVIRWHRGLAHGDRDSG
jgi:glycosidase